VYKVLCDIEDLAGYTPHSVGEGNEWTSVVDAAEENRANYCKVLSGKTLFSALYGTYTVTLNELKAVLKASTQSEQNVSTPVQQSTKDDGFQEVRRRKRQSSGESTKITKVSKKPTVPATTPAAVQLAPRDTATRNYFAPLRTADMDTDATAETVTPEEAAPPKTGRPPPVVLTSPTNLIQLQKQLKNITENFEFRNTRNGTRVITRSMADFNAVRTHFDKNNLSYFTFFPKSDRPVKAVIRHLPIDTPAEDISDGLVSLGFDVVSVKQMSAARRSPPQGTTTVNLPLFLVTLPRTAKSQEIFKLTGLCHISIRVEAYKAQTGLTQCFNCQKFGHVWANCRQPPRCLWCGGGHIHKECPEKGNAASTPSCCNCKLAEGEKPHPSNYRGCSHARDEMRNRKAQRTPKTTTGRVFSSHLTTQGVSFAAALRSSPDQLQRPHPHNAAAAGPATAEQRRIQAPMQQQQQNTGQSAQASNGNSASLDNMFRVASVVQQITRMMGLNDAVSEEQKIVAIIKIVMKLINSNTC
jgi:hypothetical protein